MRAEPCFRTMEAARFPMQHRMRSPGEAKHACGEMGLHPQGTFVTNAAGDTVSIQSLKQGHHDAARTPKCLTQLAHSCGSVFGNEFGHLRLHAVEALAQ